MACMLVITCHGQLALCRRQLVENHKSTQLPRCRAWNVTDTQLNHSDAAQLSSTEASGPVSAALAYVASNTMPTTDLLRGLGLSRNPFTDRTAEKTNLDVTSLYSHSDLQGFEPSGAHPHAPPRACTPITAP
jgi:hypothetical protein